MADFSDISVRQQLCDQARKFAFDTNDRLARDYLGAYANWKLVYVRCAELGQAMPPALVPPTTVLMTEKSDGYPELSAGPPMKTLPPPDISKLAPAVPSGFRVGKEIYPGSGVWQALPGDSFKDEELHEPPDGVPFKKARKQMFFMNDVGSGYWIEEA